MTFIEKQIARSETMLARWHGKHAKMHELAKLAVKSLRVVVSGEETGKNLFIACIDPIFICGPVEWNNSHMVLRPCILDDGEEGAELLDEANQVRIVCHTFEVKENVKLKGEG
jgi:hypothetical protein